MVEAPVGSTRYASFLVRLWRSDDEAAALPGEAWQGEAEHLQTRQRWTFETLDELLTVLHRELEEVGADERE